VFGFFSHGKLIGKVKKSHAVIRLRKENSPRETVWVSLKGVGERRPRGRSDGVRSASSFLKKGSGSQSFVVVQIVFRRDFQD